VTEAAPVARDSGPQDPPFLTGFGLFVTYRCQVACEHCIVSAGPHRTEQLDLADAHDWVTQMSQVAGGRTRVLSLTGGEPFVDIERLRDIGRMADVAGLFVTAVTNAHWATSPEIALDTLSSLPEIRAIAVSADVHHQALIPLDRVKNAVRAAQRLDRIASISICTDSETSPTYLEMLEALRDTVEPEMIDTAVTFPVGRAQLHSGDYNFEITPEPPLGACCVSHSPVVFPNGDVIACIGPVITLGREHPLFLGNLHEERLAEIVERAQSNTALHLLRLWGPSRLVRFLAEAGETCLPEDYVGGSICHACYALMANPETVSAIRDVTAAAKVRDAVALGRLVHLNEAEGLLALDRQDGAFADA